MDIKKCWSVLSKNIEPILIMEGSIVEFELKDKKVIGRVISYDERYYRFVIDRSSEYHSWTYEIYSGEILNVTIIS